MGEIRNTYEILVGNSEGTSLFRRIWGEGKAIPLQAWTSPEGSRSLRLPDFKKSALEGGRVVSPTRRPPLPAGNIPGTHFCYRLSQPQGHSTTGRICQWKIPITPSEIEPATFRLVAQCQKNKRAMLKCILKEWDVIVWTGFIWHRIMYSCAPPYVIPRHPLSQVQHTHRRLWAPDPRTRPVARVCQLRSRWRTCWSCRRLRQQSCPRASVRPAECHVPGSITPSKRCRSAHLPARCGLIYTPSVSSIRTPHMCYWSIGDIVIIVCCFLTLYVMTTSVSLSVCPYWRRNYFFLNFSTLCI